MATVDYPKCLSAANACLQLAERCGDLANFRLCASFNCSPGIPFFPAAYHASDQLPTLTLGLESGDLLFLAFHGAGSAAEGSANLFDLLRQVGGQLQTLMESPAVCGQHGPEGALVRYGGLDASINPGLLPPDSVGAGLEAALTCCAGVPLPVPSLPPPPAEAPQFGDWGTLAAVSAVTAGDEVIHLLPAPLTLPHSGEAAPFGGGEGRRLLRPHAARHGRPHTGGASRAAATALRPP